jgi:hypothetical protein
LWEKKKVVDCFGFGGGFLFASNGLGSGVSGKHQGVSLPTTTNAHAWEVSLLDWGSMQALKTGWCWEGEIVGRGSSRERDEAQEVGSQVFTLQA